MRELFQERHEAADVLVIQRRVELVEHAERRRLHRVHGEHQRHRRQRTFAPGEQTDVLQLAAGRLRQDVDAGLQQVPAAQPQLGAAAAEEAAEQVAERARDRLEGGAEPFGGLALDLGGDPFQVGARLTQVLQLVVQEPVPLGHLLELLRRQQVDLAQTADPFPQPGKAFAQLTRRGLDPLQPRRVLLQVL